MTFQDKDFENIKIGVLSVLKKLDSELQSQLGDLKVTICEFPGLKVKKMNIKKDQWTVTIESKGEDGAQSMLHIMDLFAQNSDLNVNVIPSDKDGGYELNGPDPEVVTIWLQNILADRLNGSDRMLH